MTQGVGQGNGVNPLPDSLTHLSGPHYRLVVELLAMLERARQAGRETRFRELAQEVNLSSPSVSRTFSGKRFPRYRDVWYLALVLTGRPPTQVLKKLWTRAEEERMAERGVVGVADIRRMITDEMTKVVLQSPAVLEPRSGRSTPQADQAASLHAPVAGRMGTEKTIWRRIVPGRGRPRPRP